MDLTCVVLTIAPMGLLSTKSKSLFLVSAEDDARVEEAREESTRRTEVELRASLQEIGDLHRLMDEVDTLVLSPGALQFARIIELACEARVQGVRVLDFASAVLELDPSVSVNPAVLYDHKMAACAGRSPAAQIYLGFKAAIEPVLALILLMLLSPALLLVGLAVRLTSPGPILYRQVRLGHRRQLFSIIKFRTMKADAETGGPVWASTSKSDSRLTPIGSFLRVSHLDELPQLWNVVRGEIGFVGPRPERPEFSQGLEQEIPLFKLRTLIRPGITGWAQVRAGYANSVDDSRRKLEFDLYYILRMSPLLDLRIVYETFGIIFVGGSEGRKRERSLKRTVRTRKRAAFAAGTRRASVQSGESEKIANVEIG